MCGVGGCGAWWHVAAVACLSDPTLGGPVTVCACVGCRGPGFHEKM